MTKPSRWAPRLAAAALLLLPSAAPLRADETMPPPYRSIRVLSHLQEQVTHGDKAAHAALPALLETIGTRFLDAEPSVWRDPRNARAAILYLFSGGRPMVVRTILSRSTMPHAMDRLLKGALAYAEGQDQIARDLLDPIDARTLMPVVGGQLALVQATLFATVDPKKARHFLDLARLLVPGSLVEEAALRQQITLETDPGSLDKFIALSRQYLHRYKASIYAQNFKQHFAAAAIKIGADGVIEQIAKLEKAIAELPPAQARAVYLAMSRAAIVAGKLPAARYAAGDAAILAKGAPQDAARATLYMNASTAAEDDAGHSMAALEAADKAHLSPQDAELRDAALTIARSVQAPVAEPVADEATPPDGTPADTPALVDAAGRALASSSQLLDQAK